MAEPLGRIRASSRPNVAPRPRIDPNAFGIGIGQAISAMGASLGEFANSREAIADAEQQLTRAHQSRENRLVRARTQVAIQQARVTLNQQVEELRRSMPADGSGFTEATSELVTAQLAAIRENIPEDLVPEFENRLAELQSSYAITAYNEELRLGDEAYMGSLDDMLQQAQNDIVLNPDDPTIIEERRQEILEYLGNSPLSTEATEVLLERVNGTLDLLSFQRAVEDSFENPTGDLGALPGGTNGGRDVAATGLPGPIRGMLNAGGGAFTGPSSNVQIDINPGTGRPQQELLNILSHTVEQVFGPGSRIAISSGHEGRSTGTRRHPAGTAADFKIVLPDGTDLGYMNPTQNNMVQQFIRQAAANGIRGIGYGANYMGNYFHMDIFTPDPSRGEGHVWSEAAGIPGLLETIQQFQPGGDGAYETPETDYTAHPGGTAGRYEMTAEAWEEARLTLGLPDFSPASQDRAAWWLAEQTYEDATGRNLQADLASGDPTRIENVRQTLIEYGDGFAMPGMAEMSREDFYNQVTLSDATLPGVFYDERYENVPIQERLSIYQEGQTAFRDRLVAQQQAADDARSTAFDNLVANIQLGNASVTDVQVANEEFGFTPPELVQLTNALESANAEGLAVGRIGAALNNDQFIDMGDEANRDAYNSYAAQAHMPAVEAQDIDAFNSTAVRDTVQTGFIAEPVVGQLNRMLRSADPQAQDFALQAMASLMARAPLAFEGAFNDSQMAAAARYGMLGTAYDNPEERAAAVQQMLGPYGEDTQAYVNQAMSTARRENNDWFQPQSIVDQIGNGSFRGQVIDQRQGVRLGQEFSSLMEVGLRSGMDAEAARDFAIERLGTVWGETSLGGERYFTRRPVESVYPRSPISGFQYIDDTVRAELGIEGAYRLVSTGQTEAAIRRGQTPPYAINVQDETGAWVPFMAVSNPTGVNPGMPRPQMIQFDDRSRIEEEVITQTVTNAAEQRASRAVMSSFTSLGAALSGLDDQTQLNPQSRPVQEARRAAQIALDRNPDSYEFLRRLLETNRVTDPTVLQYILGRTE
jgi:hypothetical protein